MKTAVSVPNDIFEQAERLAKHLDLSRSELYQRALAEYVARHAPEQITEAIDRLCATLDTRTDRFVAAAARSTLARTEW